jgi:beta-carotene 3-hydroxylase
MADALIDALAFVVALAGMEGVAWIVHRHVMHGALWSLHRSHHEARRGVFEANDLFGIAFAAIAVVFFVLGARPGWRPLWWSAAGMTAYGVLYALVHDGLVHRRLPFFKTPTTGYLGRLAQAHHLHHATHEKDGAVSFGFLFAPNPDRLRADLRRLRAERS